MILSRVRRGWSWGAPAAPRRTVIIETVQHRGMHGSLVHFRPAPGSPGRRSAIDAEQFAKQFYPEGSTPMPTLRPVTPVIPDQSTPQEVLAALTDPQVALDGYLGKIREAIVRNAAEGGTWRTQIQAARHDLIGALMERHVPASRALWWAQCAVTAITAEIATVGRR